MIPAAKFRVIPTYKETSWARPEKRDRIAHSPQRFMVVEGPVQLLSRWLPETSEEEFERLVAEWREATALSSSLTDMLLNPSYQRIIGMGPAVVPYLLRSLEREPDHWGWALRAITGQDPVPSEAQGDIVQIAKAWLDWGRRMGVNW